MLLAADGVRPPGGEACCGRCRHGSPGAWRRDSWLRAGDRHRPAPSVAGATARCGGCGPGSRRPARARPVGRRGGHASAGAAGRGRGVRGARYQYCTQDARAGPAEPTFALHVHVALPDAELGVRRWTGCAPTSRCSSRWRPTRPSAGATAGWPRPARRSSRPFRAGPPAAFATYATTSRPSTCSCGRGDPRADVHLVGRAPAAPLGTLEVRVMDAQTRVADTAALAASSRPRAAGGDRGYVDEALSSAEALEENRFLAARDGISAQLVDPTSTRECQRPSSSRECSRPVPSTRSCSTRKPSSRSPRCWPRAPAPSTSVSFEQPRAQGRPARAERRVPGPRLAGGRDRRAPGGA